MDNLKTFWNDTKMKLLNENRAAVRRTIVLHLQTNSAMTKRMYRENLRKLFSAWGVVAQMEHMVMSAIQTGDRKQADDAVFIAFERIFQERYVCIGDINEWKTLQRDQPGYNPPKFGMVSINGVFVPNGWIEPTKEQIQTKATSLANGEMDLKDMVALLPLETQDQREPKNAPDALPYSRVYVKREMELSFASMDLDNNVMDSLANVMRLALELEGMSNIKYH